MSLTGTALVSILVVLAVGLPIALALTVRRSPGGLWRCLLTFVGVVLCQVVAIAAVGVVANNQFGFYNSWGDLFGTNSAAPQAPAVNGLVPNDGTQGRVVTLSVPLPDGHGKQMSVLVWVPREYDQPQFRRTRFPVAMMLPGQPGTPQGSFQKFNFAEQATRAIEQHRVKPFVAVLPPIMVAPPRDTECTDVPRGPQAETWLYRNVRNAVITHLRVTPDGRQWSALGISTGGFCAAKLLLRHRNLFHAAVGFGAYYDAETDRSTGDLFAGSQQRRNQNAPIWLIRHAGNQVSRLLIIVSRTDKAAYQGYFYADSKKMIEATRGIPGVATLLLPKGGHNYDVYGSTMPQALAWLGRNAGL